MAIDWSTLASSSMATHSGGEVAAAAADRLGERDAEQSEVAHLAHGVERELVGPVPLLGVRLDLGGGELANDRAQRLVVLAELRRCTGHPAQMPSSSPVAGPTTPSTPSSLASWNARTASSVCSPNAPSAAKRLTADGDLVEPLLQTLRPAGRRRRWRSVWPISHEASESRS